MLNRVTRDHYQYNDYLMRAEFLDENMKFTKNSNFRELNEFFFRKFLDGIQILDREYKVLGWSSSQIKQSSCWFLAEKSEKKDVITIKKFRSLLGDFSEIGNPATRAARIGQALSSSIAIQLQNHNADFTEKQEIDNKNLFP